MGIWLWCTWSKRRLYSSNYSAKRSYRCRSRKNL